MAAAKTKIHRLLVCTPPSGETHTWSLTGTETEIERSAKKMARTYKACVMIYIDGNSWLWEFAVNQARDALSGKHEEA